MSLCFLIQLDLELVEMDSARRSVQEVRSRRHRTGPQLQRVLGHLRVAFGGHDVASRLSIAAAHRPATALSLLGRRSSTFGREMNPPNEPPADASSFASASRSARSATRSQARASGQPAPSCPPLRAFAAAIDRTWLLPEPCFPRSSSLYLQLLEAEGGSLLFRFCGEACLPETRREGGWLPL